LQENGKKKKKRTSANCNKDTQDKWEQNLNHSKGTKKKKLGNPPRINKEKSRDISRRKRFENWSKSGINSSVFWSSWILWDKPTMNESHQNVE
jgi:hypothetical protein